VRPRCWLACSTRVGIFRMRHPGYKASGLVRLTAPVAADVSPFRVPPGASNPVCTAKEQRTHDRVSGSPGRWRPRTREPAALRTCTASRGNTRSSFRPDPWTRRRCWAVPASRSGPATVPSRHVSAAGGGLVDWAPVPNEAQIGGNVPITPSPGTYGDPCKLEQSALSGEWPWIPRIALHTREVAGSKPAAPIARLFHLPPLNPLLAGMQRTGDAGDRSGQRFRTVAQALRR
jgi:hypothetical protein